MKTPEATASDIPMALNIGGRFGAGSALAYSSCALLRAPPAVSILTMPLSKCLANALRLIVWKFRPNV